MKKSALLICSVLLTTALWSQSVTITKSQGWIESAYVLWNPVNDADAYAVYYSGEGITERKIDDQLIRDYGDYFRADIPGLKAGNYQVKVAPIIDSVEQAATYSDPISVQAYDRTGFAFDGNRTPGAYNADGTPKSGAVILYLTENTKNTMSLEVTGANENPCVGIQTIMEGFKKGYDNRPLIVRMVGQVTDPTYLDKGDIVIENKNNTASYITLEGIGDDATADGWGIRVKNASNIEIRNIGFMNTNSDEGDDLGLQQNNDHIWVHHCDFFYGDAGSDSDQAKGDGALDCKKSTYVTFSYNHFWDTGKSNLLGLSEGSTDGWYITYHHNWYDHSDSRHPRVRYYSAHVYNNYYDGIAKYGIGSTMGSSVFSESNYFRNCKYPMLTSMQGSDVYDENSQSNDYSDMPTFSKEDGGTIKSYNNYMTGQRRFVPYGETGYPNSTIDFDAYVVSSRNEEVPSTVKSSYGSNTYNNFDTNSSIMYNYTADSPEDGKNKTMQYAGRIEGGDFQWSFNNSVDDTDYSVNSALKSALLSYQTDLVKIQGDGEGNSSGGGETGGGETGGGETGGEIDGDVVHNFTTDGKTSSVFSITGNLSDSKGTVSFGGLTLTQCLKIESSTLISFSTTEIATMTLVFNEGYNGGIKIDGTEKTVSNGILELELTAGNHDITKADVANLYFIMLDFEDESGETGEPTYQEISSDLSHNFTTSGDSSDYFYFSGTISNASETITYDEQELTKSLELDTIKFSTSDSVKLTLVFAEDFNGAIQIDGQSKSASDGEIVLLLPEGDHVVSSTDSPQLYLVVVSFDLTIEEEAHTIQQITSDVQQILSSANLINDYFNIVGEISGTKGTIQVENSTMTECLPLDLESFVTFSTSDSVVLTLFLNDYYNGQVAVDSVDFEAKDGKLQVLLGSGDHIITSKESANLFYLEVSFDLETYIEQNEETVLRSDPGNTYFKMYPNPVVDVLALDLNESIENVYIYNLAGRLIKTVPGDQDKVDLSDLHRGYYLIKVQTSEKEYREVLIKE